MSAPLSSMHGKQWLLAHGQHYDAAALIAKLRADRELSDTANLPSAALLPDADIAAKRIQQAIESRERVGIAGDYDCDGITAVAQLVRFFRRHNMQPHVRLPHRVHDGYGLSMKIVEEMHAENVQLIITADTGVTALAEIAHARSLGIEVIVTDHHSLPATLPEAVAIVHPDRGPYPPAPPSGAGVVFHLLRTLEGEHWAGYEEDCVLATIGTIADLVPLIGSNRTLVQLGLHYFAKLQDGPLYALADIAGITPGTISSTDIAFRIAPRINASGRMASPDLALQALLGNADALQELDLLNRNRQVETDEHLAEAMETLGISRSDSAESPLMLCTISEQYSHGIIGLIAGKLTEMTGRPSMVAVNDGEFCTASLRSPASYHITDALHRHSDLLAQYGGHAQAAGCTLHTEHWPMLCKRLTEDVALHVKTDQLTPQLLIDAVITPDDISMELLAALSTLEPYGQGNREPVFLLRNVQIQGARQVGRDGAHLQGSIGGRKMIGFQSGSLLQYCNDRLDVVCRLGIDEWQGRRQPQIFMLDMRIAQHDNVTIS